MVFCSCLNMLLSNMLGYLFTYIQMKVIIGKTKFYVYIKKIFISMVKSNIHCIFDFIKSFIIIFFLFKISLCSLYNVTFYQGKKNLYFELKHL